MDDKLEIFVIASLPASLINFRGPLLAVKGHISKRSKFHYALDGIDDLYCNYLDALITILDTKNGDNLWWTTFDEISEFLHKTGQTKC
jgi:hypothetical protein